MVFHDFFNCKKCGFGTSGIILDNERGKRWCPRCRSPLFRCTHCISYTSGTVVEGDVQCDICGKMTSQEKLQIVRR